MWAFCCSAQKRFIISFVVVLLLSDITEKSPSVNDGDRWTPCLLVSACRWRITPSSCLTLCRLCLISCTRSSLVSVDRSFWMHYLSWRMTCLVFLLWEQWLTVTNSDSSTLSFTSATVLVFTLIKCTSICLDCYTYHGKVKHLASKWAVNVMHVNVEPIVRFCSSRPCLDL